MRSTLFKTLLTGIIGVALSPAAIITFATDFGPEVPGATGSGSGLFVFDTELDTLSINVNWTGLSSPTTVAHIHCCTATPRTGAVGVAVTPGTLPGFPTGVTSGTYNVLLDLTQAATFTTTFVNTFAGGQVANADDALLLGMQQGRAYFNIHTSTFPGGEIRGFLSEVPEPGTMVLFSIALAGLAGWRRLRTQ